jgi:allantoicase
VRIDVFPDGGVARLRLPGRLTEAGLTALQGRFGGAESADAGADPTAE